MKWNKRNYLKSFSIIKRNALKFSVENRKNFFQNFPFFSTMFEIMLLFDHNVVLYAIYTIYLVWKWLDFFVCAWRIIFSSFCYLKLSRTDWVQHIVYEFFCLSIIPFFCFKTENVFSVKFLTQTIFFFFGLKDNVRVFYMFFFPFF